MSFLFLLTESSDQVKECTTNGEGIDVDEVVVHQIERVFVCDNDHIITTEL